MADQLWSKSLHHNGVKTFMKLLYRFYKGAVWYQEIVSNFLVYRKLKVFFCESREFKCEFKMVLTPLCTILHESKVVLVFAQWLFIFWQTDIRQRSHYFFWLQAQPNSPHFSLFSYFNTQIMKSWRDLSTLFFIHFHYVLLCTYCFPRHLRWDWRAEFLSKLNQNQKNKQIFTKGR